MTQTLLSADQIFAAEDLSEETVEVPEWGGAVRLVQMTAAESQSFSKHMMSVQHTDDGMFLMLVYSARNAERERIFTVEDINKLRLKSVNVLARLQSVALRLNNMGKEGMEALKKA
jgi:hypothetical protein